MNLEERFGAIGRHLHREICAEFPGWEITRDNDGTWSAVREGWGALYAQTGVELRDRLRRHTGRGSDHA
jgi:hypothetical protein